MAKQRRLKKRKQLMQEALERGITTPGGLARVVYGTAPRIKEARRKATKLKYSVNRELDKVLEA
ncbi:hypothetical protein MHLNE_15880 [Moorella humiferrea]|uniref:hypothetical protein n=1 Tax=Neomoorella humiferrea TaxID=676965 RepID=UPI0030CCC544